MCEIVRRERTKHELCRAFIRGLQRNSVYKRIHLALKLSLMRNTEACGQKC